MYNPYEDYVTAIIPEIELDQKEKVQDFLRLYWNSSRVEFVTVDHPDLLLAYGASNEAAEHLISKLSRLLVWQSKKKITVVSSHHAGILSDGEKSRLLSKSIVNLQRKLPAAGLTGAILEGCTLRII